MNSKERNEENRELSVNVFVLNILHSKRRKKAEQLVESVKYAAKRHPSTLIHTSTPLDGEEMDIRVQIRVMSKLFPAVDGGQLTAHVISKTVGFKVSAGE